MIEYQQNKSNYIKLLNSDKFTEALNKSIDRISLISKLLYEDKNTDNLAFITSLKSVHCPIINRAETFRKINDLDLKQYSSYSENRLLTILSNDIAQIENKKFIYMLNKNVSIIHEFKGEGFSYFIDSVIKQHQDIPLKYVIMNLKDYKKMRSNPAKFQENKMSSILISGEYGCIDDVKFLLSPYVEQNNIYILQSKEHNGCYQKLSLSVESDDNIIKATQCYAITLSNSSIIKIKLSKENKFDILKRVMKNIRVNILKKWNNILTDYSNI